MLAASVTSSGRMTRLSEAGRISVLGLRIVAITFHPRSRNNFAVSRPKPDEQPVMRTLGMMCSGIVESDPEMASVADTFYG